MKFVEAFNALGYRVEAPRHDWSASKKNGVCLALWRMEIKTRDGMPWLDTMKHCGPIKIWGQKPGNATRKIHLQQAVSSLAGVVDVIILDGIPGVGFKNAHPWQINAEKAIWRVTSLDPVTGHFGVQAESL